MIELYESIETATNNPFGFSETDIPEPIEHWSLDDFEDFLPDLRK